MKQALLRFLANRATAKLVATNYTPDFVIGRKGDEYLLRWYLIPRNRFFNIYLHKFLRSDQDFALHDHPWLFNASLILKGSYVEHYPAADKVKLLGLREACRFPAMRFLNAGDFRFRWGRSFHRVELWPSYHGDELEPVWTIFVTGPVVHKWGFMCPKGFRPFDSMVKYKTGVGSEPLDGCPD